MNFIVLFVVFEWDRIFEREVAKSGVQCSLQSCPSYFSVKI